MSVYKKKPYGWMPPPELLKCPKCGTEMRYVESEGSDADWGRTRCICYHVYECDGCRISAKHHIEQGADE